MFHLPKFLFRPVFIAFVLSLLTVQFGFSAEGTLPPLSPEYPYEAIPNPGIPTLQEITANSATDDEALQKVVDYYNTHESWLRDVLAEGNPTRLRALYAMFVVHISHIYGEAAFPPSFLAYLAMRYSHCGNYSVFQSEILNAFGLTWRIFTNEAAEHSWVEVEVDDHWELFDSTTNVWIDQNGFDLIQGVQRSYRALYTPMNDITRPDAREHYWKGPAANPHVGWYNMPRLRQWMPGLGLYYTPKTAPEQIYISSSAPGAGSENTTPWIIDSLASG